MKILFIRPPITAYADESIGIRKIPTSGECLAFLILSEVMSNECDIKFLDMEYESDMKDTLAEFKPDIVGVTCPFTPLVYATQDILKKVKEHNPEIFTAVGGIGSTNSPWEFNQDYVDVIVMGEGERTFKELVKAVDEKSDYRKIRGIGYRDGGNLVFTEPMPFIEELDKIPFPNRNLCKKYGNKYVYLFWGRPMQHVGTTRGCRHNCKFCSLHSWGNHVRPLCIERAVQEYMITDAEIIECVDDDPFYDPERADQMASSMKQEGFHKYLFACQSSAVQVSGNPGLIEKWRALFDSFAIGIGFESIDARYLKKYNKPSTPGHVKEAIEVCEENDICLVGAFLIDPDFDKDDFQRLRDFVIENEAISIPIFFALTPLPGSKIYQERANEIKNHDWRFYDQCHMVLPTKLPRETFDEQYDSLWDITKARVAQYVMSKFTVSEIDLDVLEEFG